MNKKIKSMDDQIRRFLDSKFFFYIACFIAVIGILVQIYCSFSKDIWLDEAFSLQMIKHTYKEMILLTAQDVHPPLYYIILKSVVDILMKIFSNGSNIFIGKMVSIIPEIILILYVGTIGRKRFGNTAAGMFIVCLIGMPQLISYGVEIRMYSWAMLFVTASFFSMYDIMTKNDVGSWIKFLIFSLLASYTHYFACISVAFLYIFLLFDFLKENKKRIKMWVIISSLTIIGYIPWMIVLLNQLKQVRKSYWIPEITWQSILSCVIFVFEKYWLFVIYIFALLLSFIDLKKRSQQKKMIIAALMIILWTAFVGIVLSKLFRPIFIPRYLVPSMACLWFGISAILSIQKKEFIKMIIVCIMFLLTFQNIYLFLRKERAMKIESNQLEKMISKIDTNDSKIITTTSENCRVLSVKIKGKSYLWKKENSKLSQNVYEQLGARYA